MMRQLGSGFGNRLRAALGGGVVAVLLGAAAAQDGPRGRLFSLYRSQDNIHDFRLAEQWIAAGDAPRAVVLLHDLLHRVDAGVVPVDDQSAHYLGLRRAALFALADLPAPAQAEYDAMAARQLGSLIDRAFDGRDRDDLARVAEEFPTSAPGRRARILLGDLALERGDAQRAAHHLRAALDAMPSTGGSRDAVLARLRAAAILAGAAAQTLPPLRGEQRALLDAAGPGASRLLAGWPAYGGGAAGNRVMDEVLGRPEKRCEFDVQARGFPHFPMHAAGSATGIYVNDGQSVIAVDPLRRRTIWQADGPMVHAADIDPRDYEESINRDYVLSAACSADLVVAALQVPDEGQSTWYRSIEVIRHIPRRRLFAFDRETGAVRWSHWDQPGGARSRRFAGHDAATPPLIDGDTVYIGAHDRSGTIAYYLSAYDLHTGALRWRQLVCSSQGEVNIFGNARREYAGAPLAIDQGVVYGATNLGVCFAADAADGNLRWVNAYPVVRMPETRLTDQQDRRVVFANNPVVVADGVMACTPLDSANALGFDGETGELLWMLRYRDPRRQQSDLRWLLGAVGDEFVFSGLSVVKVKARGRGRQPLEPKVDEVRSPAQLGVHGEIYFVAESVPRGALAGDSIYFASPAGLRVFGLNGDSRRVQLVGGAAIGNLMLADGVLTAVRNGQVEFYYDTDALVRAAEQDARGDDTDPAALLKLAALIRADAAGSAQARAHERAEELYRRGLALAERRGMSTEAPVYRRLAGDLFELTKDRALALRSRSPDVALRTMRAARDGSLEPRQWLTAQRYILGWLADDREAQDAELLVMADRHGDSEFEFGDAGTVPINAYVTWQRARHADDPLERVRLAQELIERFGEVTLAGERGAVLGRALQADTIAAHGVRVYSTTEERAARALREAGEDAALVRAVTVRFPVSAAAREARNRLLDMAVARGDLGRALEATAVSIEEGAETGNILRRLQIAAGERGNHALAASTAARILARYGEERSDYAKDRGAALADVVTIKALPRPPARTPPVPVGVVARLAQPQRGSGLRPCVPVMVPGFDARAAAPLLVSVHGEVLQAYDPSRGAGMFDEPIYTLPYRGLEIDPLYVFGDTLVLLDGHQVRAYDVNDGAPRWQHEVDSSRLLEPLGCRAGLLHVFSEHRDSMDAGALLGLEPLTGTVVFRRAFGKDGASVPPISSGDSLWILEPGEPDRAVARRMDPLTGRDLEPVVLGPQVLDKLRLTDRLRRAWRFPLLHRSVFADSRALYFPVDGDDREPSRLVAVGFDGKLRWPPWTGSANHEVLMCATAGDRILLVEAGPVGGNVVLIDPLRGDTVRKATLGHDVTVRNWRRGSRSEPAPPVLLLEDRRANVTRNLICFSLDPAIDSFRYTLPRRTDFRPSPVLTREFLAVPTLREEGRLDVLVLAADTRRSLLRGGGTLRLRPQPPPPYRLHRAADMVLLSAGDSLYVLGDDGSQSTEGGR